MNGLRRIDLEALLDFLVDAGEFDFDRPYPPGMVARLGELVPNDCLAYQELDVQARRTHVLIGVEGAIEDDEDETLYWSLGPCPISIYRAATGDLAAVRVSDVTDRRRYIETPFYKEYFEPVGLEHMIDLGLPAAPAWHRSFILFRTKGDRDFSVRDREMLDALRPHLARLEAEASLRRRLADALGGDDRDAEPGPYSQLTTREREIVELVAEGKTNAQIAAQLWVAPSTVKKHLEHVYEKLGVGRRTAAANSVRGFR